MRIQVGEVFSLDTGDVVSVGDELLVDGGDVPIVPHDLLRTLQLCGDAVSSAVRRGRVPILLGGDDALLYACARRDRKSVV